MKKLILVLIAIGSVCAVFGAAPKKPFIHDWKKRAMNAPTAEQRREKIKPVALGELRVEPLFNSAGITFGAKETPGLTLQYRKAPSFFADLFGLGDDWQTAEAAPYYFAEFDNYRGMIWGLEEDTEYEIRVKGEGVKGERVFRTWKSEVPVAKTVVLDRNTKFPLAISDKGSEDGWIRYTAKEPLEWNTGNPGTKGSMITLTNATYVLIDDMVLAAPGAATVVDVVDSRYVRIRNCEISKWGALGQCLLEDAGHYAQRWDTKKKRAIGTIWSQAIRLGSGAWGSVVERCYLHDPLGRSTTWRHSHPSNLEGISVGYVAGSTVIRWCDLPGSDAHRWDDAIPGPGNFAPDGGFNRTAEIYGNFLHLPNDDSIELDGGQQNIACYGNRFEGGLVGCSIQGCVAGPSFVFDNLFSGLGEERGETGTTIKTSGFDIYGIGSRSWVARNTLWGRGSGISIGVRQTEGRDPYVDVIDNVFCGDQHLSGAERRCGGAVKGNRLGVEMKAEDLDPRLPVRPLPFTLDAVRIEAGENRSPRTITVKGGDGVPFKIAKCEVFDWFDVSPKEGVLKDGMTFTLTFNDAKMKDSPVFRGSFLVRTPEGLSRPVSVYASSGWTQPEKCEKPGEIAIYRHPSDATKDKDGFDVYTFTVPKTGRYYFLQYAMADKRPTALAAVDDEDPEKYMVQTCYKYPVWSIVHPGQPVWSSRPGRIRIYSFKKGTTHTLRVKSLAGQPCDTRAFCLTDAPLSFEPLIEYAERERTELANFRNWPEGKAPQDTIRRVITQFAKGLENFGGTERWTYKPEGYAGNNGYGTFGKPNGLHYCTAILWSHAIKSAALIGEAEVLQKLLDKEALLLGPRAEAVPAPHHVDMTVFGMLPLQAYLAGKDERNRTLGIEMAETQWKKPIPEYFTALSTNVIAQNFPMEKQLELWKKGFSPQTRLWIDDMFMITAVQTLAFQVSRDKKYLNRAAKEMVLYLDELQIKEGPDKGLFYHAPDVPYLWARGDGWMAAGMARLLKFLPPTNENYGRIMRGYLDMMAALKQKQRPDDGLWEELLGDRRTWPETSGTGMFTYAFVIGVKRGWLGPEYAPLARKAYLSLVDRIDRFGNVSDVCIGTAKKNDYQYYVDRAKVTGDPHGQSPLLWICEEFLVP